MLFADCAIDVRTSTLSKEEEHNQNPIPIATGNEIELEDWDRLQVRVRDLYHLGLAGWLAVSARQLLQSLFTAGRLAFSTQI